MAYSQAVAGLVPGTVYYFCAMAEAAQSPSFGEVLSFTTRAAVPSVTTNPPTEVWNTTALLNASVAPRGDATTTWFRYSDTKPENCSDSFGLRAPLNGGRTLGAGGSAVAHSEAIFGLTRGTTYYYCAIAQNAVGTTFGEIVSFTPGVSAPIVVTEVPTAVEATTATVAGTVHSTGSEAKVWFRYGESDPGVCDDSFGIRVSAIGNAVPGTETNFRPDTTQQTGSGANYVSEPLPGLRPSTTYYYCVAASNQGGAKFGQVRSFTTTATALAIGTVTTTVAPVESMTGCSYSTGGSGSHFSLLVLLPLLGYLLLRRRRFPMS